MPPAIMTGVGPNGHVMMHYQPPDANRGRAPHIPDALIDPVLRELDVNAPQVPRAESPAPELSDHDPVIIPVNHPAPASRPVSPTPAHPAQNHAPTRTPTTATPNRTHGRKENAVTAPPALPSHLSQKKFDKLKANFQKTPARNNGIVDFLKEAITYVSYLGCACSLF